MMGQLKVLPYGMQIGSEPRIFYLAWEDNISMRIGL
ncbi:MAG: hypothetical protein CM15mP93_12370 [Thiotrichaceae bacterium]|nr:MAG: hypothetical protein CM15mP93_12370 [Thiotrichaceae bacterium]